jgi:hypothetical protein
VVRTKGKSNWKADEQDKAEMQWRRPNKNKKFMKSKQQNRKVVLGPNVVSSVEPKKSSEREAEVAEIN